MILTEKIIITDTNIITDLDNAEILKKFIKLDNVFISDMVKNDEINFKTCNVELMNQFKVVEMSSEQLKEMILLSKENTKLSRYDLINYVIAKDNNYVLATGDNNLKKFAENNGVIVVRTLKIIEEMRKLNIILFEEEMKAYHLLLENKTTRIPKELILERLKEKEFI